ncbi:MAG: triacylglycerol lipase [Chrysiogenetes bacterium]|nr:triacylglycerol lipase [Chrysiogenetes bacterium]
MKQLLRKFALAVLLCAAIIAAHAGHAMAGGSKPPPPAKYPVVLSHGFLGFDELLGVVPYFYRIPEALRDEGHTAFTTEVSSFNSIAVRGEQLVEQIEEIRAITGKSKVNLLGHSMGGLDVRYAAHVLGATKVASVTTMGTPHRGAPGPDILVQILEGDPTGISPALLNALGTVFGGYITNGDLSLPQDATTAVINLSSPFLYQWNQEFTNVPGIYYQSYTGSSVFNISLDPLDAVMAVASVLFLFEPNDGLVGVNSAKWGNQRNMNLNANHMDEVNQLLGSTGLFGLDARGLYKDIARDLQKRGY